MRTFLTTLLVLLAMTACTQYRGESYPSDSTQPESNQVRDEMALLNTHMQQIDQVLLDGSTISSEQQEKIIALLARINEVADRLAADGTDTSHEVIVENIDRFQGDVEIAMRDASANPPNYYALGRLAGSCNACHRLR